MRSQRYGASALIGAALLPILALTLSPQDLTYPSAATLDFWCVACGYRGTADFLLNLVLFLPLGAALRSAGLRPAMAALVGLALSGSIETAQLWMPGRYTSFGDLVANGLGAGAGAILLGTGPLSLRGPPSVRRQMVLTLLVATVWIGTMAAFQPSLPEREYYGQWTARLGQYAAYHGRVLEAAVGDQPAPSWRLESSETARQSLLTGDTVTVTALAGPAPGDLAPIFSVYDDEQEEVLLLGADEDDLVLRVRRRAADLRLEGPDLRWTDALKGVAPGDTLRLAAWRSAGTGFCVRVGEEEQCEDPTIGRGWVLLLGPQPMTRGGASILDALWLVALVALALWWAPGRRASGAGLAVLVVVAGLLVAL